jgi:2-oxoacid:acceptor oxidoreductase delta subunit (pyruvate/2-ketoisovalerate family)
MISEKKLKNDGVKGIPHAVPGHRPPNKSSWRVLKPVCDYSKCIKCHLCWLFCPDSAIKINKKGYPETDSRLCKGCGLCARVCPVRCIKMVRAKRQ